MVIVQKDFDLSGPLPANAVPLLVVRGALPIESVQDRMLKRDLYERLGVPAYWIVDPTEPFLLALRLVGGRYEAEYEGGAVFRPEWPFPVSLTLADLAT